MCNLFAENLYEPEGLIDQKITGGYTSTVLGDMNTIQFSLCEE